MNIIITFFVCLILDNYYCATFSIIPNSPLLITSLTILPALWATDTDDANNLTITGTLLAIITNKAQLNTLRLLNKVIKTF